MVLGDQLTAAAPIFAVPPGDVDRRDLLQPVHDTQPMQVASVKNQIDALKALVDLRPEIGPRLWDVRVRNQPNQHANKISGVSGALPERNRRLHHGWGRQSGVRRPSPSQHHPTDRRTGAGIDPSRRRIAAASDEIAAAIRRRARDTVSTASTSASSGALLPARARTLPAMRMSPAPVVSTSAPPPARPAASQRRRW